MKKSKNKLKVFLCHASEDKPIIEKYYDLLIKDGIEAWLDSKNLLAGQDWEIEIQKTIEKSDAIIVFLSSRSTNKEGYIQREIKMALDKAEEKPEAIFLIPAKIEDCEVPKRISKLHWINLFENFGYENLLKALLTRASNLGINIKPKKYTKDTKTINEVIKKTITEAKNENSEFGINAEKIYLFVKKYSFGEPIPKEFWQWYENLSETVHKDSAGKLIFTGKQLNFMNLINWEMRQGGFVIRLAEKEFLLDQLERITSKFRFPTLLEKSFFQPFLAKSREDVYIIFFVSLINIGIQKAGIFLRNRESLIETFGNSEGGEILKHELVYSGEVKKVIYKEFPEALINTFWQNPEVADFAKKFLEHIWNQNNIPRPW